MNSIRSVLPASLLVISVGYYAVAVSAADLLFKREAKVQFEIIPEPAFQHGVDKWRHGGYIRFGNDTAAPSFYTFDGEGNPISASVFNIPDADHIEVKDFDMASDSSVALCGVSSSAHSRQNYFIAWMSPDGKQSRVVRTNPYWPFLMTIAPDGTIWAVGVEVTTDPDGRPVGTKSDGHALRHFDNNGKLIGSVGTKSSFPPASLVTGFVVANHDRVGLYTPPSGEKAKYIEFSLDGQTRHEYPGAPGAESESGRVSGLTLTEAGSVFLTFDTYRPTDRLLYTLDRASGQWTSVKAPPAAAISPIWGYDGELLVFAGPNRSAPRMYSVVP